jgi:hypothetical protein
MDRAQQLGREKREKNLKRVQRNNHMQVASHLKHTADRESCLENEKRYLSRVTAAAKN